MNLKTPFDDLLLFFPASEAEVPAGVILSRERTYRLDDSREVKASLAAVSGLKYFDPINPDNCKWALPSVFDEKIFECLKFLLVLKCPVQSAKNAFDGHTLTSFEMMVLNESEPANALRISTTPKELIALLKERFGVSASVSQVDESLKVLTSSTTELEFRIGETITSSSFRRIRSFSVESITAIEEELELAEDSNLEVFLYDKISTWLIQEACDDPSDVRTAEEAIIDSFLWCSG